MSKKITLFLVLGHFLINAQNTIKPQLNFQNAAVVSTHPVASKIGKEILQKGGNAIDAAIAVNFALAVVHPSAGNIGGGGFLVYRDNKGDSFTLDYREKAPQKAHLNMYQDSSGNIIPDKSFLGSLSIGVPGTVKGMNEMHQKFGSLPWNILLEPAIDLAKNGIVLTYREAKGLNSQRELFIHYNGANSYLTKSTPFKEGDILYQKDLSKTLKRIAKFGPKDFYEGKTAKLIVNSLKNSGGIITLNDLKNYNAIWRKPIISYYKNYKVIGMPPPSSGGIALAQLIKMMEPYPLNNWGPNSDSTIQLIIEAERRVFADRSKWLGDPDFFEVPQDSLLSDHYILTRMKDFQFGKSNKSQTILPGNIPYESPQTTHYTIIDQDGNAVSITTTLNNSYGSKVFIKGGGFLMNDEMDDFSSKPGVPNLYGLVGSKANEIQPGKRMLSSMTPTIIEKDGELFATLGTPGGSTIITSVFQVFLNLIEFDMKMQEAVEFPRFHHQWLPDNVRYENNRFSKQKINYLESIGYELIPTNSIGLFEGIRVLENKSLETGADHRGDDTADGF
ncbi:MAG: hypothetical protein RIR51_79 [Bacteroidota bacterium]